MIDNFISTDAIWLGQALENKRDVLQHIANNTSPLINLSKYALLEGLISREALQSTSVGKGVALPHCVIPQYDTVFAGFLRLENPIDFGSSDKQKTDLFLFIISSSDAGADHLRVLAKAARLLRSDDVRCALRDATDKNDVLKILSQ
ncbi:MAG: PTS sugar transporter subunit IIA [Pseudomonadota bacterium]